MINEVLMSQGQFDVPLSIDAPWSLLTGVAEFGHIVITDQQLDPIGMFADADILTAARYTGVVLGVKYKDNAATIYGAGLAWWLGSEDGRYGPIYTAPKNISGATLDNMLTNLLPTAITKGTVNEPDSGYTYEGDFYYTTPLQAFRTTMQTLGAEWKINPDGTMDAGDPDDLYTVTSPTLVAVRKDWGSDPTYSSFPASGVTSVRDASRYVTRTDLRFWDTTNVYQSSTRSTTYKDLHGNTFYRASILNTPLQAGSTASNDQYLETEITARDVVHSQTINTSVIHMDAQVTVGDGVYVYDPPVLVDTANQIAFRGDLIHPVKLRILENTWPLVRGMGLYYRDLDGAYTDLSRFVEDEGLASTLIIGEPAFTTPPPPFTPGV